MKIYIVLFCAVLIANNQIKNTYAQTTNQPGSSSNRPGQNRQCEIINGLITFLSQRRNNIGCSNSGTGILSTDGLVASTAGGIGGGNTSTPRRFNSGESRNDKSDESNENTDKRWK
ncbi:hypothetical protein PVAND_014939 [Polypedilum vanderplanki]|uniref:Uncharacterized protein n=1 Tax=Polypedilum vanderplanki TaxID=319348 RepID=A0A9J6BBG6_POLVA|nr:hypothetical protein PVAND_014939 [Polypedilum vanderplanki]